MIYELIISTVYLLLPAYFANMAPVFSQNLFPKLKLYPLDFGKHLRGKRIFGAHKSFNGLFAGVIFAILLAFIQYKLQTIPFFAEISVLAYDQWLLIGILMGLGALLGDAIKSFFKRRVGIKPGGKWIPFDQWDFVIGSLALLSLLSFVGWSIIITALIVSFLLHVATNHIGYALGMRDTRW